MFLQGQKSIAALTAILLSLSVIHLTKAYDCYKVTDKDSKSLDLAVHSSSTIRNKRDATSSSSRNSTALEFDIGDYLQIPNLDSKIISNEFTVSLWIYLEGGQPKGGTILGLLNTCFMYSPWSFKLHPAPVGSDQKSKLTFTIEDVYRQKKSVSMETYQHHSWFHLAVTNSENQLRMYVNGVRIATEEKMDWIEFTDTECVQLRFGRKSKGFRGKVRDLRIADDSLGARIIKQLHAGIPVASSTMWLTEPLSALKSNWTTDSPPVLVQQLIGQKPTQTVTAPACGQTVCDNPSVVMAYSSSPQLNHLKTVALEVVVIANSDGSEPSLSLDQISTATDFISASFLASNIHWEFNTRFINSSILKSALIMVDCWPDMIGDRHCDKDCKLPVTDLDGGDCNYNYYSYNRGCTTQGDGICDSWCNTKYYGYDYGDCCLQKGPNCFDPFHENRTFYHLSEIKDDLQLSEDKLSLIALNWMNNGIKGIGSLPWEHNADVYFGTVIVDTSVLANPSSHDTVVHELGHVLGLWHVHHGSITEMKCTDKCLEKEPSLVLGDLCSDTSPTVSYDGCGDPDPDTAGDTCGISQAIHGIPSSNFMSYSNGTCHSEKVFTPQQAARMHCYLDLVHAAAVKDRRPSAIPLPPLVVYADTTSVTLSWLPPLSPSHSKKVCKRCDNSHRFTQYVETASMAVPDWLRVAPKRIRGAEHVTGPPDSAPCKATEEVWSPTDYYYGLRCTSSICQFNFTFAHPVRPHLIRMWMPWHGMLHGRSTPIAGIDLISPDGEIVEELNDVHVQCDKPFTRSLKLESLVDMVIVYTHSPKVAFDAIELTSAPNSDICTDCESLKYEVKRDPPFTEEQQEAVVSETSYEDKSVEEGIEYTYTITAMIGEVRGFPSKGFHYTHDEEFCGDGKLIGLEECDDGNTYGGDGCSTICRVEQGYTCIGMPSICWLETEVEQRHCAFRFTHEEDDGCGYYVPPGYSDQWASSVTTIGKDLACSSDHLLLGPPPPKFGCQSTFTELSPPLWFPCYLPESYPDKTYQLKFGFEKPIVLAAIIIHLGSDGDMPSNEITASQVFEGDDVQKYVGNLFDITCRDSVQMLPVTHDLSTPFKRTKEVILRVSGKQISIAAVRVRTFANFDPVTLGTCESILYNTATNQCEEGPVAITTLSCPPLEEMTHGNLTCTGNGEGDECLAICNIGYETSTVSGVTKCVRGRWTPSLTCDIVQCSKPEVYLGYADCDNGHHYNSVCDIACGSSSTVQGNGTVIKCTENGIWTEARSDCVPVCPDLTTVNAEVTDDTCQGEQKVGVKCQIQCKTGYYIKGPDVKMRRDKPTCRNNGKWDRECVRVQCPGVSPVWSSLYNCTDGANSGSVCKATCSNTQVSVISCSPSGRWNGSFSACGTSETIQCPSVSTISRPDLTLNATGTFMEAKTRVSCRNTSLVLHRLMTSGSKVMATQFRDKLHCSSLGLWTPSLEELQCDKTCREHSVGDGWCDGDNNRASCNWDGGDCCHSTTKTMQVQNFPETCTSLCTCKDPNAEESRSINRDSRWHNVHSGYAVDYKHN